MESHGPTCPTYPQLKFTGKPVSQTTGLYYEYQRWYDPSVGRFVSEDALPSRFSNPQSSNKYVYVNNAPTTFTDPSGLGMIVGNGRPPCWDWFGLIPCNQGGAGGLVSATTTSLSTSPEGAPIIIAGIGLYLGSIGLYDVLSDYFATRPPSPPPTGGDDLTGRQGTGPTVTPPTITIPGPDPTLKLPVGKTSDWAPLTSQPTTDTIANFKWQPQPLSSIGVKGTKALACLAGAIGITAGYIAWSLPTAAEQRNFPRANQGTLVDLSPYVFLGTFLACGFIANQVG